MHTILKWPLISSHIQFSIDYCISSLFYVLNYIIILLQYSYYSHERDYFWWVINGRLACSLSYITWFVCTLMHHLSVYYCSVVMKRAFSCILLTNSVVQYILVYLQKLTLYSVNYTYVNHIHNNALYSVLTELFNKNV